MRSLSIAFALSTLLLLSVCSAQQTSDSKHDRSGQDLPPIGGNGTSIIQGSGTVNYIPIWATPNYLLSSVIYQASGNIGIGTTTPAATLDINGAINAGTSFNLYGAVFAFGMPTLNNLFGGGSGNSTTTGVDNLAFGNDALLSNTTGYQNTALGIGALQANTTGHANMAAGIGALNANTTGVGNTAVGFYTLPVNTTGGLNTALGAGALQTNTRGGDNTAEGWSALGLNTLGAENTANGYAALYSNNTGNDNVGDGIQALFSNTPGNGNTAAGDAALNSNTTGNYNAAFGYYAGVNSTTGSDDVYIANQGPSSGTETNTIRIGTQGTGNGQQNATYVAGIYGVNVGGIPVQINSNGQLGAQTSSLRFKEQVHDMGDSTNDLMKLRPVTFFYKPQYDDGSHALQYGLIAEEVAQVYPELVAYDNDGQPYSVRYQYLTTMLLNEAQKQCHRAQAEAEVITSQEQKIEQLEQRLSRLEGLVQSQVQTVARERE